MSIDSRDNKQFSLFTTVRTTMENDGKIPDNCKKSYKWREIIWFRMNAHKVDEI